MSKLTEQHIPQELEEYFSAMRKAPPSDPQLVAKGRAQFITRAKTIKTERQRSFLSRLKGWVPRLPSLRRKSFAPALAGVLIALMIALTGVAGTAYAAQNSLPNDALYPVKLFIEDLKLELVQDPEREIDLMIADNFERVEEMKAVAEKGEDIPQQTIARFQQHTQSILRAATQLQGQSLSHNLLRMRYAFLEYAEAMTNLVIKEPGESKTALLLAQNKLEDYIRIIEQGILDPDSYQPELPDTDRPDLENGPEEGEKNEKDGQLKPESTPLPQPTEIHPTREVQKSPTPFPTTNTVQHTPIPTTITVQPTPTGIETSESTPVPTTPSGSTHDRDAGEGGRP